MEGEPDRKTNTIPQWSWSRRVGTALGDAVLGLMLILSREAGEPSQENWLLQEVTSR